jgi:hypothetical protein
MSAIENQLLDETRFQRLFNDPINFLGAMPQAQTNRAPVALKLDNEIA